MRGKVKVAKLAILVAFSGSALTFHILWALHVPPSDEDAFLRSPTRGDSSQTATTEQLSTASGMDSSSDKNPVLHREYTPTDTETTPATTNTPLSDPTCHKKERLVQILMDAGVANISSRCAELPTWKEVTDLYGPGPIIVGLETCAAYRASIAQNKNLSEVVPRIAGLYNTGTNALAKLFELNWNITWLQHNSYFKYDVPWGKHVPPSRKYQATVPRGNPAPKDAVLPIVLVRDPFWWMMSMCKNSYGAKWKRQKHCPNLVVAPDTAQKYPAGVDAHYSKNTSLPTAVPVTTHYQFGKKGSQPKNDTTTIRFSIHYESLIHVWNSYYREYYDLKNDNDSLSQPPRIMIRFEDILFHGPAVLRELAACVGIQQQSMFRYSLEKSKQHGRGTTDFVQALIQYGSSANHERRRRGEMSEWDQAYAKHFVDAQLLQTFGYQPL
jgi:hypothetical protein